MFKRTAGTPRSSSRCCRKSAVVSPPLVTMSTGESAAAAREKGTDKLVGPHEGRAFGRDASRGRKAGWARENSVECSPKGSQASFGSNVIGEARSDSILVDGPSTNRVQYVSELGHGTDFLVSHMRTGYHRAPNAVNGSPRDTVSRNPRIHLTQGRCPTKINGHAAVVARVRAQR